MNTRNVVSILFDLSENAIKKFNEYLSIGKIRVIRRLYTKYKVEKFNYSKSGVSFYGTRENIIREELDPATLREFINDIYREDIFKYAVEILTKLYGVQEAQARLWLEKFVDRLVNEHYKKKLDYLDYKELTYLINTFLNEVEGNPIDWHVEVWLRGVYLEVQEIELEKGVILRVPHKEDLEYDSSQISLPPSVSIIGIPFMPDAIMEMYKKAKRQQDVLPFKEKLIVLLQLYKLCSAYEVGARWAPKGVLSFGFTTTTYAPEARFQNTYKCTINENDAEQLPNFIRSLISRVPLDEKSNRILVNDYIGVALSRYQDVLLKPEPVPNKIAYATFGLEALYLRGGERSELTQRLALRVAKVLSKLAIDRSKNIFNNIKRAYKIRSAFVHGEIMKSNKYQDRDLLDKIAEYLRISLLLFMQVQDAKDRLIELTDDALIDEDSDKKLKEVINANASLLNLSTTEDK